MLKKAKRGKWGKNLYLPGAHKHTHTHTCLVVSSLLEPHTEHTHTHTPSLYIFPGAFAFSPAVLSANQYSAERFLNTKYFHHSLFYLVCTTSSSTSFFFFFLGDFPLPLILLLSANRRKVSFSYFSSSADLGWRFFETFSPLRDGASLLLGKRWRFFNFFCVAFIFIAKFRGTFKKTFFWNFTLILHLHLLDPTYGPTGPNKKLFSLIK